MPWRPITVQNITSRFTVAESAMLVNTSGAVSALQTRLTDAIAAFDSALIAVGNNVAPQPNMVDSLRNDVMAMACWQWLRDFPTLKTFATDARREANKDAEEKLKQIALRQVGAVEDPNGYNQTQNWNSENKIIMRMSPVPPPDQQYNNIGNPFPAQANPNATSNPTQLLAPQPPKNLWVKNVDAGQLQLFWAQPSNAYTYLIYRGTASGAEVYLTTVEDNFTYIDNAVTAGVTYWYYIIAGNSIGQSGPSNESNAIVLAT